MKKFVALVLAVVMMLSLTTVFAEEHEEVTLDCHVNLVRRDGSKPQPFLKTMEEFQAAYPWIKVNLVMDEATPAKDAGETLAAERQPARCVLLKRARALESCWFRRHPPLNDYLTDDIMSRIEAAP